jgi:hypothetical protein
LWQGATNGEHYGIRRTPVMLMHRWVWQQVHGPIPPETKVLHRCDQPLCFRYDHLFVGTQADNIRDMMNKGRGRGQFPTKSDAHPARKLTLADHAAIRARYTGTWGEQAALAREYNVTPTTILQILNRRGGGRRIHPTPNKERPNG